MKNKISISTRIILFGLCMISTTIGYSRDISDTLVITDFQKFKQIPTCIGENCQSGHCSSSPKTDGPAASHLLHDDVRIGKIKHCTMLCETPKGVCRKMIFTLRDADSVSQAGKQGGKQFGKPVYTKEGSKFVYAWKHTTADNQILSIKLEVSADIQSGKMYVNAQD